MQKIVFSVIIPLKSCNEYLNENIHALLNGSYQQFEIIVLPDNKEKVSFPKTTLIPTGNVGPAEKRDRGATLAKGKYLAFIDDDAYPSKDWLKNALVHFKKQEIAAVCGPGVTPPADSVYQKASGAFSASLLGGGPYTYRFIAQKARFVDDYPSMNLLVRKADFWKVDGFDSNYWPGEDTKLCLDLTHKLHKKIYYHPTVLVYHHRRPIFTKHLIQNGRYGLYRGYFARVLPKTSLRLSYFIPSVLLMGFISLPVVFLLSRQLFYLNLFFVGLYLALVILASAENLIRERNLGLAVLLIPTIIVTHLFYGYRFIKGYLFTTTLKV